MITRQRSIEARRGGGAGKEEINGLFVSRLDCLVNSQPLADKWCRVHSASQIGIAWGAPIEGGWRGGFTGRTD